MNDDSLVERAGRTAESRRFESLVKAASMPGLLPKLADIRFNDIADVLPWVAMVKPDAFDRTLKFTMTGTGFVEMQGRSLLNADYLDFFDPAFKGEAFDGAFLMLTRPCGLWQITPVTFEDGSKGELEYTGFPVFDDKNNRGLIMFMIRNVPNPVKRILLVGHSTTWEWLDVRGGLAL